MLIVGIQKIAKYCGKAPETIYNWIHAYGFPAAKAPGGEWLTDPELIRRWILARHEASLNPRYMRRNIRINAAYAPLLEKIERDIRSANAELGLPDELGIAPGATTAP